MPRNDAAAPGHVCPGIRIHTNDIVQPPGIFIPPIADMEAHQAIVSAALPAKSSAENPKKARCEARSETMPRETSIPQVAPRGSLPARFQLLHEAVQGCCGRTGSALAGSQVV